jgi:tetratricopeptide (TPR) repeat protein
MSSETNLEVMGNLIDHPLAELFAEIGQSSLNGSLRLSRGEQKTIIYFDGGDAVFAVSNARQHRLFHLLLRGEKISVAELQTIPNFVNDVELKVNLIKKGLFTEQELKEFFVRQVSQVLLDALSWSDGNWIFSPAVRVKGDIRVAVDVPDMLFSYARAVPVDKVRRRFKSFQELFTPRAELPAQINLLPQEAFVFSRFDGGLLSVEEVQKLAGLSELETLKILYVLWLGGFLARRKWQSAISDEKLAAILSAKFQLKSKAHMPNPVQAKKVEEKPAAVEQEKSSKEEAKPELSLEEFLERVETASSYYELLDVPADAEVSEIKSVYFHLAKRFHPDLFYRRVEDDLHRRIQNAFSELAHAYETLRNKESREIYDFKLRKEIANLPKRPKDAPEDAQSRLAMIEQQAAESFDHGFDLIMEDEYEEAIPYLARAVHLVGGNARYRAYYGKALSANKETYHQAEAEFQAALRLEPDNVDYRLMLAELFIKIGLMKRAEGELKRILAKSPNHREARFLLDSLHNK